MFAVIGYPIAHSLSPAIHQAFARQFKLALDYIHIEVQALDLNATITKFIQQGGKGFNVTAPYKEILFQQITELSASAKHAQAVNTVTVQTDGTLFGDNTDGIGFIRDATVRHKIPITKQRILILGAGGAVRGILQPLLDLVPQSVCIANRDLTKAHTVADYFSREINITVVPYAQIVANNFDIIINATSASLANLQPLLPAGFSLDDKYFYDLNYGAKVTPLFTGLGMLVEQAAEAFYLWHKLRPNTESVIAQLHANIRKY